jgi:hypothetical protein
MKKKNKETKSKDKAPKKNGVPQKSDGKSSSGVAHKSLKINKNTGHNGILKLNNNKPSKPHQKVSTQD